MSVLVGRQSHRGQVREKNEDACLVLLPPNLAPELNGVFAVADGMGGHRSGEVASRRLMDMLGQLFATSVYQQWVDHSPTREDYYVLVVKEVLEKAHDRLYTLATGDPALQGMGTTVTLGLLKDSQLYLGHVGDSRAYLLRGAEISLLTQDHRGGEASVLSQALGASPMIRVDRAVQAVRPGDVLVLCTDGLHELVSAGEIQQVVQVNVEPQMAADELVALANARGGPDNITALVVRFMEAPAAPAVPRPRAQAQPAAAQETPGRLPVVEPAPSSPVSRPSSADTQKIFRRTEKRAGLGIGRLLVMVTLAVSIACLVAVAVWRLTFGLQDIGNDTWPWVVAFIAGFSTLTGMAACAMIFTLFLLRGDG